jgi:hypothetical protein
MYLTQLRLDDNIDRRKGNFTAFQGALEMACSMTPKLNHIFDDLPSTGKLITPKHRYASEALFKVLLAYTDHHLNLILRQMYRATKQYDGIAAFYRLHSCVSPTIEPIGFIFAILSRSL